MLNEPLQRAFSSLKRAAVLPDGREEQAEFSFEEILKNPEKNAGVLHHSWEKGHVLSSPWAGKSAPV